MKYRLLLCSLCTLGAINPVIAVPVVPNFTQGSMTSHTETTSTVVETINSMDYATGWTYSVSGSGVELEAGSTNVAPDATTTQNNTINGVTSTWTGLDLSTQQKPNFVQTTPGAAFQFTEHYSGPGLQTHTVIQRTQTVTSVTDTTSIFQHLRWEMVSHVKVLPLILHHTSQEIFHNSILTNRSIKILCTTTWMQMMTVYQIILAKFSTMFLLVQVRRTILMCQ